MYMFASKSSRMYLHSLLFTGMALTLFDRLALCNKTTLHIGALFPITGSPVGSAGREFIPVSELALEAVNNRTDILPGYHLTMFWNDTKCNPGYGTNIFFESVYTRPEMLMVLGAGCSSVTQLVAEASALYNLLQVSYASTASDLSDKNKYPYLYRVVPSDSAFNAARVEFLKYFKWKRIATLQENAFVFSGVMKEFQETLTRQNFQLVSSEIFADDARRNLQELKQKDARVIVGMFYKGKARKVFCEAFKQGMYGAKYVWLLLDWYDNTQWWLEDDASIDCTKDQMTAAVQGYFSIESVGIVPDNTPTLSRMTLEEFYKALGSRIPSNQSRNMYAPFVFDSIWVIALTLNKSLERLDKVNKSLEAFSYKQAAVFTSIFTSALKGLKFQGITGPIQFDSKGERARPARVKQMKDGHSATVGLFYPLSNVIVFNGSKPVHWQGDGTPADSREVVSQVKYVSLSLFCVIVVLASAGILLALIFLYFNVRYRNHSYIKLSSPNFNNLIIVGCVLLYTSTYFIAMDGRTIPRGALPGVCASRGYFLAIGYSIALGAMFSKTWRVYQIFNNANPKKKVFKDGELLVVILVMVFTDILVLSVWTAVDMPELITHSTGSQVKEDEDVIIVSTYEVCHSRHITTWLYIIMGYKVLLLLVLCFLAWVTRNVKARALNDSHLIAFSVYNIVVFVVFGVPLTFLIHGKPNAHVAILCLFIIIPTTVLLCLLFIPKITKIKNKPEEMLRIQSLSDIRDTVDTGSTDVNSITRLEAEVLKLKREVNDLMSGKETNGRRVRGKGSETPSASPRPGLHKRAQTCHSAQELAVPTRVRKRSRSLNLKSFTQECCDPAAILKAENQELKRHVQEFKISETGKLAKLMCENAELRRKVVESTERSATPELDATTRLIEENAQLKKQLGEVSIRNSVWSDTTPRLQRKQTGDRKISKELRELTHLLTVDLGCRKAEALGSTRLKRLPPIGRSQSTSDLLGRNEAEGLESDDALGNSNSNMVKYENKGFKDETMNTSEVQIVIDGSENKDAQSPTTYTFELGKFKGAPSSQEQDLYDVTNGRAEGNLARDENHNCAVRQNGALLSPSSSSSNGVSNTSKSRQNSTRSTQSSLSSYAIDPDSVTSPREAKQKHRRKKGAVNNDKIEKTYFV